MITKQFPISASTNGAVSVSSDGSTFVFEYDNINGISIPSNAFDCTVELTECSLWWVMPNILLNVNDKLYINDGLADYILQIPQGLYGVSELNNAISVELLDNALAGDLISIIGDEPTGKVILQINYADVTIDWSVGRTDTFRDMLGFDIQTIGPSAGAQQIYADNTAVFNTINWFVIKSNITNGIPINGTYTGVLSKVNITNVMVGDQIVYEPMNPIPIESNKLIGSTIHSIQFTLANDNNVNVNTNGEPWGLTLIVKYNMLL